MLVLWCHQTADEQTARTEVGIMYGTRKTDRNIRNGYDKARGQRNRTDVTRTVASVAATYVPPDDTVIRATDPGLCSGILADMGKGAHYDYEGQKWYKGNDHVHIVTVNGETDARYCGKDYATCNRGKGSNNA